METYLWNFWRRCLETMGKVTFWFHILMCKNNIRFCQMNDFGSEMLTFLNWEISKKVFNPGDYFEWKTNSFSPQIALVSNKLQNLIPFQNLYNFHLVQMNYKLELRASRCHWTFHLAQANVLRKIALQLNPPFSSTRVHCCPAVT